MALAPERASAQDEAVAAAAVHHKQGVNAKDMLGQDIGQVQMRLPPRLGLGRPIPFELSLDQASVDLQRERGLGRLEISVGDCLDGAPLAEMNMAGALVRCASRNSARGQVPLASRTPGLP